MRKVLVGFAVTIAVLMFLPALADPDGGGSSSGGPHRRGGTCDITWHNGLR